MNSNSYEDVIARIEAALHRALEVFKRFTPGEIEAEYKAGHDPVTEADRAVDTVLRETLLRDGEGWLSEESADDLTRLENSRVWVVDPLDGTREFVQGIPEWCVSIGFVESGRAVAGGICNPATQEIFLGSVASGIRVNGKPTQTSSRDNLEGALVLASRSEVKRGEWKEFGHTTLTIQPMGSVAYKMARVAAGLADATFTLTPKNEWDVAAGAALVESAGGTVRTLDDQPLRCNNRSPLLSGLVASGTKLYPSLRSLIEAQRSHSAAATAAERLRTR
jgi:myo-inositol-1(or 4)-monophosphatase